MRYELKYLLTLCWYDSSAPHHPVILIDNALQSTRQGRSLSIHSEAAYRFIIAVQHKTYIDPILSWFISGGPVSMPAEYYDVTKQTDRTDFHLLHLGDCSRIPARHSLVFIGSLYHALPALTAARLRFGVNVNACYSCCLSQPDNNGNHPLRPVTRRPAGGFKK